MKLKDDLPAEERALLWQQRFFEAQAACEEYIMEEKGADGIYDWIDKNSKITAKLLAAQQPVEKEKLHHFVTRITNQLKCYNSTLEVVKHDESSYEINNFQCGILKYRLEAERKGVKLTFKSPCFYCKKLNTSIAGNYIMNSEVSIAEGNIGCKWIIQGLQKGDVEKYEQR